MHAFELSSFTIVVCGAILFGLMATGATAHPKSWPQIFSKHGRKPRGSPDSGPFSFDDSDAVTRGKEHCLKGRSIKVEMKTSFCENYYKQTRNELSFEQMYSFQLAKMKSDNFYRLIVHDHSGESLKYIAFSAVSASHHYIGNFSLSAPSETKSYPYYKGFGVKCNHTLNANYEFVQYLPLPLKAPYHVYYETEIKIVQPEPSPKLDSFHVNVLITPEQEIILGKYEDGTYDEERNKFIFIISTQTWDIDGQTGGDCYLNFYSRVFSLGKNKVILPDNDQSDSMPDNYEIESKPPFDKNGKPVIDVLGPKPVFKVNPKPTAPTTKSTTTTTTTTATTTKAPAPTDKAGGIARQGYRLSTIKPVVTDPNALLPDYVDATPKFHGSPGSVKKKSKTKEKELGEKAIYQGCGKNKGCIGEPPGCVKTKSCTSIVTYGEDDDFVKFELMGKAGKYVAMGLSWDRFMGNDSVVECVREYRTQVNAYMSWNFVNRKNSREANQEAISRVRGKYLNGLIICEFWRRRVSQSQFYEDIIDLAKEPFYVLQACGNSALEGKFGNIDYHSECHGATKDKYLLHTRFRKTKLRIITEKIHGVLMLFAWLFCMPLSAFISRYFKETYKDRNCVGYTVWYAYHVIIAWAGIGANVLAMACSVIGLEPWKHNKAHFLKFNWHFHNQYGLALLAICFISPMAGYIIKQLNPRRRCQVVNYVHGVIGLVSLWFAIIIIFHTTRLDGGLPCRGRGMLITWIVFYIILHLFMSYMVCYVDFVQGERVSRAYNIFLLRTAPHPPYEDVTGSPIRKCLLCLYVSCFTLLTTIIILMHVFGESCVNESVA